MKWNLPHPSTAFALLLLCVCTPLFGLQIHEFDPQRHLRFGDESYPQDPAPNLDLWAGAQLFHGVGWSVDDPVKSFALISPRHFVGANHFRPALDSEIAFLGFDGQVRTYTYTNFYNIKNDQDENTDIFIGELAEDIPASHGVPLYPIFDTSETNLVGSEIIVYGRGETGPRIGRGEIGTFSDSFGTGPIGSGQLNDTRNYSFEYLESTASQDDSHGETGDSGNPSFLLVDGMPTVTGIHSAVQSLAVTTTYDSFLLHYRDQISDHLANTGHQLTFAPVEPGALKILEIQQNGNEVVLQIENDSDLPYDVQQTDNLLEQNWDTVSTSETGSSWTGEVPAEAQRLFWRVKRYPLPASGD